MLRSPVYFPRKKWSLVWLIIFALFGGNLVAAEQQSEVQPLPDIADYPGKVVVLDFWASWCVPCRRSFPWLNAMHAKYADQGLVIIAVNLDADREAAERFLGEYPADFQVAYDPEAKLAQSYDVITMPSSLLFGRSGDVRAHHNGFRVKEQGEYEAAIVAALSEP